MLNIWIDYKPITVIILLLAHLSSTAQNTKDKDIEREKIIAASQTGGMPLYFKVKAKKPGTITVDSFNNDKEFYLRSGLPNLFNKIKQGRPIKLGYIGGSITRADDQYRLQSAQYLQQLFPSVTFEGINAGVSGTGSELGACRINDQLLQYDPDVVFIEFAVNGAFPEGVEGMIRQIWKHNPYADVCLLYTIYESQTLVYADGLVPSNIIKLEEIADHYQIPSIHMGLYPAYLEKEGKLVWKPATNKPESKVIFTSDGTHPTKAGGDLYASAFARSMLKLRFLDGELKHTLKKPFFKDNWEDAKMFSPNLAASFSSGWESINPEELINLKQFSYWFPYVMKAQHSGDYFTFCFKGNCFGFFDIGGPEVGQLEIKVDQKKICVYGQINSRIKEITFGPDSCRATDRFNANCDNRYRGQFDMFKVPEGEHIVKISISAVKSDKKKILGPNQLADINTNPEKYNQTVFYLGKILIRGEMKQLPSKN